MSAIGCSQYGIPLPSIQTITTPYKNKNVSNLIGNVDITNFSLRPDENATLIDGHLCEFEVDLEMMGQIESETEWEIRAVFNNKSSDPFSLSIINQEGLFRISSTITWKVPVYGEQANIQMNLYRVVHSMSGKTTLKTLVQSIQRSYNIICDRDELFFILQMKRFF